MPSSRKIAAALVKQFFEESEKPAELATYHLDLVMTNDVDWGALTRALLQVYPQLGGGRGAS